MVPYKISRDFVQKKSRNPSFAHSVLVQGKKGIYDTIPNTLYKEYVNYQVQRNPNILCKECINYNILLRKREYQLRQKMPYCNATQ